MSQFVHLHVHTQYSILDGASDIKDIIGRAKELGQPALAITDHGNMFGVKLFHEVANKEGIKPILGSEVYVARNSRHDHSGRENLSGYHLILLAKNLAGYHNLARLASYAPIRKVSTANRASTSNCWRNTTRGLYVARHVWAVTYLRP